MTQESGPYVAISCLVGRLRYFESQLYTILSVPQEMIAALHIGFANGSLAISIDSFGTTREGQNKKLALSHYHRAGGMVLLLDPNLLRAAYASNWDEQSAREDMRSFVKISITKLYWPRG